jgi:hypothetical protein
MHINLRSIAQKVNSRISGGISREIKCLNDKTGPLCDDLYRWEGVVMILENVRGFLQNSRRGSGWTGAGRDLRR